MRLQSAVYYCVTCEGEWVAEAPASCDIAAAVMPGAQHVIEYHVVTAGECWAGIVGQQPLKLRCGDVVLLPQGDAHVVSSAPGMRAKPQVSWYYETKSNARPFRVSYAGPAAQVLAEAGPAESSGEGEATTLVCGFIGCDLRPFNPVLGTLPRLLHLPAGPGEPWSQPFLHLVAAESTSRRPGSEALLARASEMLFIDAVRRHVERLPETSGGWLAGLRDRFVGRALALLHERPAAPWSVEALSREVGLSRSALHERFLAFVGQAPMQYLGSWRMQLASRMLLDTQSSVASIALEVGYESEAAFARAFKRSAGAPPAAWRRLQRSPVSDPRPT